MSERRPDPTRSHYAHREGWPKRLPCLACGEMRTARHAGDRLHLTCRSHVSEITDDTQTPAGFHGIMDWERCAI
jgi:hypothetical protein